MTTNRGAWNTILARIASGTQGVVTGFGAPDSNEYREYLAR